MKLENLCEAFEALNFPAKGEDAHPDEDTVRSARSSVTAAVVDDEFLADCLGYELRLVESDRLRQGLAPFYVLPDRGIQFSFGHWAPGATPGPHEHTAWTITAVCRNELDVFTYDREASYKEKKLVPKNHFQADAGKVGFIYSPCIHAPINNSAEWSLSFHVTSPRDGERPACYEEPIPELDLSFKFETLDEQHAYVAVMKTRQRRNFTWQIARILSTMEVPTAAALLAKCYDGASSGKQRRLREFAPWLANGEADTPVTLARTSADLALSCRFENGVAALFADTPAGPRKELETNAFGRNAMAFVANESSFSVRDLPGKLSGEEKMAFAEALEETALFRRIAV